MSPKTGIASQNNNCEQKPNHDILISSSLERFAIIPQNKV